MYGNEMIHLPWATFGAFVVLAGIVSTNVPSNPRLLSKRAIEDEFTPHDPPFRWSALGDSYTAGPGAGSLDPSNSGNCARFNGSYAPQLENDWPYTGENKFTFTACSGARTWNVIDDQLPTVSKENPPDLVVMTIGGNDVLFGKIIKSCLVNLINSGDCEKVIEDAHKEIASSEFRDRLDKIYDGILEKMPKEFNYQIIQLGYSKFFNADAESTWCNDQTFGKYPFTKPLGKRKLTLELRHRLNTLVAVFNIALWNNLVLYARSKREQDGAEEEGWLINRIFFGYIDGDHQLNFNGHRFCEPGIEDPTFNDPSTWFFGIWGKQKDTVVTASYFSNYDVATCTTDSRYEDDAAFAWECDMANYYASPDANTSAPTITGSDFLRGFHPKTQGFTNIKKYLSKKILEVRVLPDSDACIQAPGVRLGTLNNTQLDFDALNVTQSDLDAVNITQSDFSALQDSQSESPASLCSVSNGYATALPSQTVSNTGNITSPPPTTSPPSTSQSMTTYACSTISDNEGIQCKCGPYAEGESPDPCPASTVVPAL